MTPIELQMSDSDISILKNKITQTCIIMFTISFFIIALLTVCYYSVQSFFIILIGAMIFSVLIYAYAVPIFGSKKDLTQKIKINNKFKIIDKSEGTRRKNPSTFKIIFDSEVIKSCNVSEKVFYSLKVNDVIDIEYTKYGNWILSVKYNGTDIESKYHIL